MTTLSKEDVVRVDNDLLAMIQKHFPSLPLDDRYTDWGKWLGFAKAVYSHGEQAARADLVAENEQLKKQLRQQAEAIASTINKHHTALAAAEADNERLQNKVNVSAEFTGILSDLDLVFENKELRNQLAAAEARETKLRGWIEQWCKFDSLNMDLKKWLSFSAEYRAFQRDDSALREMIAGVYEECAKVCELMNYTDPQPHHYAYAIRALAEKAKGK